MDNSDRKSAALEMRLNGFTYERIGKVFGISRQRVEEILSPPKGVRDLVKERANGRCESCGIVTSSGHIHHKNTGISVDEDYQDIINLQYLCPSCHRIAHYTKKPDTNVQVTLHCEKCNHIWIPLRSLYPWVCPQCGSPEWDGENASHRRMLRRLEDDTAYPSEQRHLVEVQKLKELKESLKQ